MIDTHALLWFLADDPRLGRVAKQVMADPGSDLVVPAVALGEAAWIAALRRTSITDPAILLRAVAADPRVVVVPLDFAVIERATRLTMIHEMHDRQIVATALVLAAAGASVALVTKDSDIVASGVVPIVW